MVWFWLALSGAAMNGMGLGLAMAANDILLITINMILLFINVYLTQYWAKKI
jgi:hypothetical protein